MHALILANGEHPPLDLIQRLKQEADLFIVADGAANALHTHGVIADIVLGDFDSLLPHVAQQLPEGSALPILDQETSDLDKALAYAAHRGATRATVMGFGGGRLDHTFTAASLLLKHADSLDVELRDARTSLRLAQGACTIEGQPGDTISLIFFAPADGVTLEGVEWPLRDETLLPGSRGVSNRLAGPRAELSIRSGWALLCHLSQD